MLTRLLAIGALVVLTVAGCGGDSKPELLSGTLRAGGVQGVRYTTTTQSGETDANGAFQYRKGETVYFTIGNVILGAAPGASEITLFTLSGLQAPANQKSLRLELNRASLRNRTPFANAMNRQRLLLALDADHDARNGYDLRGRAAELSGATLNFDQAVFSFEQTMNRLSPNLTRNVPTWMSVVLLYRGIGLQVAANEEVRREQVDIYGGSFVTAREHTPEGLRFATRSDSNGDGAWEYQVSETFDSQGRSTRVDVDSENWLFPERRIEVSEFDARGNLTVIRAEYEVSMLARMTSVTRITLDSWDREDIRVIESDHSGDGDFESRAVIDTEYDARGNVRSIITETDSDADGAVNSRETYSSETDTTGRVTSFTWESDYEADGVADDRQGSVGTWSADNREFVEVSNVDYGADGVFEFIYERRYQLDARGQARRAVLTSVSLVDSSAEQEDIFENDADGRTLTQTARNNQAGTGFQYTNVTRNRYDDAGNLIERIYESDDGQDGSIERRATYTASMGSGGELLGATYSGEWDWILGRSPSTLTVTNRDFASGVAVLAQKYFSTGGGAISLADATVNVAGL